MTDTRRVRSSDFFTVDVRATVEINGGDPPIYVLDTEWLDEVRAGPSSSVSDIDMAEGLCDLLEDALLGHVSREQPGLTDMEVTQAIRTLGAVTQRLGIPVELPFRNFTTVEALAPLSRHLDEAKANAGLQIREDLIANLRDPAAIREHLARLQRIGIDQSDPPLAIGTAKELVESTAKTVLQERGFEIDDKDKLPALVRRAQEALGLHPVAAGPGPDGTDAVRRILSGLTSIAAGLGELRNRGYGTGHGPKGERVGLRPRHARLAVNAAVTWCSVMLDTLADPEAPWREEISSAEQA
jgi:hypothetical protein